MKTITYLLKEKEFNKIIFTQDEGYPEHNKLRKKLKNIWLKNKNFQNLLDEAIYIIKK